MSKLTVIEPVIPVRKKRRIAAYCRVSTGKDDQKHSFQAQQEYFRKHCIDSASAEPVQIYADIGSGTSTAYRPDFHRMLEDCQKGLIDHIITKSLSRFARNTKECLTVLRDLKQMGVSVYFEKENIDTSQISDEIMITIMEGLAQEESSSISRNIRWSLRRKMADGTLGIARVPFGYQKINGQLVIEENSASIIRRIFALYLSGYGARRIALLLNEEQIPSPTCTKWNNVTILKILRQEKYIGDIHWQKSYAEFMGEKRRPNHGEWDSFYIRDCLPPIISREDYVAVQELRERNTRQSNHTNLSPFRRKTKCICGRSFFYRNNGYPVWECTGKYSTVQPCTCPVFKDALYHAAWNRMCQKLRHFADEIILPCLTMLSQWERQVTEEESRRLEEQEIELSNRKYVLYALCSEGCITTEKLIAAEAGINRELEELQLQLKQILPNSENCSGQLLKLYRLVTGSPLPSLSDSILVQSVTDGQTIEFELLGGLKLREVLQ